MNKGLEWGSIMSFIQLSGYFMQIKKHVKILLSVLALFFIYLLPFNTAQALEPKLKAEVSKIIDAFKQNDRVAISYMVSYPLLRHAPLAPINNHNEFLKRYDEIFDKTILDIITRSNIHTDWDHVGWRGVILDNGIVALDPEGKIIDINYDSPFEKAMISKLNPIVARNIPKGRRAVGRDRGASNFNQAVVEVTTPRFHIRIDDIGQGAFRYASWPIDKKTSDAPDLILNNGRILRAGRNQRFVFDNGTYSYQLNIDSARAGTEPSGSLEILKGGQPWIREVATQIIHR